MLASTVVIFVQLTAVLPFSWQKIQDLMKNFLSETDFSCFPNVVFERDFVLIKKVAVANCLSTLSGNFPSYITFSSFRSALRKSCSVQFVDLCSRAEC